MTLAELCSTRNIKLHAANQLNDNPDFPQAKQYACQLVYEGNIFSFPFWRGVGNKGKIKVVDCLECLLTDANAGQMSFADFCCEFGYDVDSRKAKKIHKQCKDIDKGLRRIFGKDFEEFATAERE